MSRCVLLDFRQAPVHAAAVAELSPGRAAAAPLLPFCFSRLGLVAAGLPHLRTGGKRVRAAGSLGPARKEPPPALPLVSAALQEAALTWQQQPGPDR